MFSVSLWVVQLVVVFFSVHSCFLSLVSLSHLSTFYSLFFFFLLSFLVSPLLGAALICT